MACVCVSIRRNFIVMCFSGFFAKNSKNGLFTFFLRSKFGSANARASHFFGSINFFASLFPNFNDIFFSVCVLCLCILSIFLVLRSFSFSCAVVLRIAVDIVSFLLFVFFFFHRFDFVVHERLTQEAFVCTLFPLPVQYIENIQKLRNFKRFFFSFIFIDTK